MTTQDRCSRPPRSLTIVGSAVDTMVWSRAASSSPSSSAPIGTSTLPGTCSPPPTSFAVPCVSRAMETSRGSGTPLPS
ncbi:hypothetical protein LT493_09595 [Streptomyces tricolor]|nr:hypothetical protein [Streptomyces tricolor]